MVHAILKPQTLNLILRLKRSSKEALYIAIRAKPETLNVYRHPRIRETNAPALFAVSQINSRTPQLGLHGFRV